MPENENQQVASNDNAAEQAPQQTAEPLITFERVNTSRNALSDKADNRNDFQTKDLCKPLSDD